MQGNLLQDVGFCIVTATAMAYLGRLARQPLILAYIAAGVLIGPLGLRHVTDPASIRTLAELGLAFLLFIVGLEIDLKKLIASGKVAAAATLVQVFGSALLGGWAAARLGFGGLSAVYIGTAVSFSSTLIVVKLLSDRSELDTLAGRTTLAMLLVQDALAVLVLAAQPSLGGGGEGAQLLAGVGLSVLKGLALVAGTLLASRFLLPPLFHWVAKFPEIVLISAVSWCFLVCYAAMQAGFSSAMGALLAGVSISAFPYALEVVAKIRTLRDFFVTLFFVSLGLLLIVPTARLLIAALVLSGLVVAGRFLTVVPMLRLFAHDNRVSFLSSIHLSQTSEFGLIILLIGASDPYRHVGSEVVSLVVMVLVITATVSTYLVQNSHALTALLVRKVSGTPLEDPHSRKGRHGGREGAPIVLVGCFRVASSLVHGLLQSGRPFKVIDFNPRVQRELEQLGVSCAYGDISHLDTLEDAGVREARVLVSSIPDDFLRGTTNRKLLESLRRLNPGAAILVTAESVPEALALYGAGADYVLLPRLLGADRLMEILESAEAGSLEGIRDSEIRQLGERKQVVL
jgi:Kef-type K+ transport system membrane component KefB/voltage-gated potassium channel Kch